MREYIRHPFGHPIEHRFVDSDEPQEKNYARNVSEGGLCFHSKTYIAPDQVIQIDIPIGETPFQFLCQVSWCNITGDGFEVGVKFENKDSEFTMRLVEQACYIEEYRKEVALKEGRELTEEEAATEWIDKYAQSFPK
jgi:hypothetical protein